MDIKQEKTRQESMPWDRSFFSAYNATLAYFQAQSVIENTHGGGLLDLACGDGTLTALLSPGFSRVVGLDASGAHLVKARANCPGAEFYESLIETFETDERFDVVTMLAVIEHLLDPRIELDEIRRILKDGGLLAVATHNIDSMLARIMGKYYPWLCEMHLYHFSPYTLGKLLENSGFKIIKNYSYGQIYNLGYVGQKISKGNFFCKNVSKILSVPFISKANITIDTRDAFLTIAKKI